MIMDYYSITVLQQASYFTSKRINEVALVT